MVMWNNGNKALYYKLRFNSTINAMIIYTISKEWVQFGTYMFMSFATHLLVCVYVLYIIFKTILR